MCATATDPTGFNPRLPEVIHSPSPSTLYYRLHKVIDLFSFVSGPGVTARLSSIYQNKPKYSAGKAIDGEYTPVLRGPFDKSVRIELESLANTKTEQSPWLQIDLAEEKCVSGVMIWNRENNPKAEIICEFPES